MLGRNPSDKPRKNIRLSQAEIDAIRDELDEPARQQDNPRRKHPRYPWRSEKLLVGIEQDGVEVVYQVPTRNISIGGICFLHGYMAPIGQELRLLFQGAGWSKREIYGRICQCRRVKGSIYEVGVRYVQPAMGPALLEAVMEAGEIQAER